MCAMDVAFVIHALRTNKVMRGVVVAYVTAKNARCVRRVVVGTIRRLMNVAATIDRS